MKFSIRNKNIKISELVKRYELGPIEIENSENPFAFTIDVLKSMGEKEFYCRVYRKEFFRLKPSFQKEIVNCGSIEGCDEELLVEDFSDKWSIIRGHSPEEVLQNFLQELKKIF